MPRASVSGENCRVIAPKAQQYDTLMIPNMMKVNDGVNMNNAPSLPPFIAFRKGE